MPTALTLSGSIRHGSQNEKLAGVMGKLMEARGIDVTPLTLRDYPLPLFDDEIEAQAGEPEAAVRLAEKFKSADMIFLASPEYNASLTPLLKNAIDWLSRQKSRPFSHAVFGLGSASSGKLSGVVGLSHLRDILSKIHASFAPTVVTVGPHENAFTEDGFVEDIANRRADMLIDQMLKLSGH